MTDPEVGGDITACPGRAWAHRNSVSQVRLAYNTNLGVREGAHVRPRFGIERDETLPTALRDGQPAGIWLLSKDRIHDGYHVIHPVDPEELEGKYLTESEMATTQVNPAIPRGFVVA